MGRNVIVALLSACLIAGAVPSEARRSPGLILKALDTNHDNSIDLTEANSAGSALFDRLDVDRKGSLGQTELAGRVNAEDLKYGPLSKAQYLAIVEGHFRKADANHDGKLDINELTSAAGAEFVRLVFYVIVE